MAKKKSKKLALAIDAFGPLSSEVLALGKPLSVHPLNALGRMTHTTPTQNRLILFVLAGLLVLVGCFGLVQYQSGVPLGRGTADGWWLVIGAGFGFAAVCVISGFVMGSQAKASEPNRVLGLMVFPDAVVQAQTGNFLVVRWEDVSELHAPASKSAWTVVANDGREVRLPAHVADESDAIINICKAVEAVLLPRYLATLEAGKKVMFGPFGVSRRYVYSKDEKLPWTDVTKLEVVNGRLHVRRGGLLPWCDHFLMEYPNGFLAGELVRRLSPPELLVAGDRPRW